MRYTEVKAGEVPLAAWKIGPSDVSDLIVFFDEGVLTEVELSGTIHSGPGYPQQMLIVDLVTIPIRIRNFNFEDCFLFEFMMVVANTTEEIALLSEAKNSIYPDLHVSV